MKKFDFIIIWSWAWWLTCAFWLAWAWKKVALIEKSRIGGDCTNFGCVPSKALLSIVHKNKWISDIDALNHARKIRESIRNEEKQSDLEKHGIHYFQADAKFVDNHIVKVWNNENIYAEKIIIATGSKPIIPNIPGFSENDFLNNENIFEQENLPKKIIVLWWGAIGLELVEVFAALGIDVTLVHKNKKLLNYEDPEVSDFLYKYFQGKWVNIYLDSIIEKKENWKILLKINKWDDFIELPDQKIFFSIWRKANTTIDLNKAGIKYSEKWISVDKYSRTNKKHIFAIWDCVENNPKFTHWANNEWRGVVRNTFVPFLKKSVRNQALPRTLYTFTEASAVWLNRENAEKKYGKEEIKTISMNFSQNDRSKLTEETDWFVQIHFQRGTWKILWASIVAKNAWEMISIISLAIKNKISAYKLSEQIFPYPSKSEIIKKVADKFVVSTLSNIKSEWSYWFWKHKLKIFAAILWTAVIIVFFYFKTKYNLSNIDIAKALYHFITNTFWGPFLYIFIYAIRPLVLFPATFLTFMSWAIFGVWGGLFYTIVWENISANFSYYLWKIFWKDFIKQDNLENLWKFKSYFQNNAFEGILLSRLLFFPFDAVNYISWFFRVKWSGYFWATLIGTIPGSLVFVLAGASVENVWDFDFSNISLDGKLLIGSWVIFIISLLVAKILRSRNKKLHI